jgi:hypothetical protein
MPALTLQQALIPSSLQIPLVLLIMVLATAAATYFTVRKKELRNYWTGNRGLATMMFLVVLVLLGQGIEIPELVFAGINLLVALVVVPLLLSGFVVTVGLGPKGKVCR